MSHTVTLPAPPMSPTVPQPPAPYHWTVDAFYRATDASMFAHPKRLELIHGRIIEHMPPAPRHAALAGSLAERLRAVLPPGFTVREEKPLHLASDTEPTPDISIVSGKNGDYINQRPVPAEVGLLVEVAVSSTDYDLGDKAGLYAQAGIAEYWIILVGDNQLVVHRQPAPGGYESITRLGITDTVSLPVAEGVTLPVEKMLRT